MRAQYPLLMAPCVLVGATIGMRGAGMRGSVGHISLQCVSYCRSALSGIYPYAGLSPWAPHAALNLVLQ